MVEHGGGQAAVDGLGPWRTADVDGFESFPDISQMSIAGRFFEVARRFPTARAISSPAGSWSYGDLAGEVARRSAALAALVGTDSAAVAVMARHDGPLVVALLSVIASGNVVVVVDPAAPLEAQRHVLRESGAVLVVHDGEHAEAASKVVDDARASTTARCEAVAMDDLDAEPGPVVECGPRSPVMLAFTSGSAGEPKAAIITQAVLLNVVRGATNALGIGPDDRMPMLFPTSLAVAAYPLFLPLLNGGTLATLDVRSVGLEPFPDFLADERITVAYMAPTVMRFLVDALADRSFPDVRMIALGGELVDAEVVRLTDDLLSPDLIAVGYGTTESGVVSLHVQDPADPLEEIVSCGHPVPEVEIVILDEGGDPVEPGGSGEIAVVSPHMFDGYKGHAELNRQVLSADPLGRPGWQLYRTGDFGRLGAGGTLVVSGRIDTKVKVRGRLVVLGDVEADLHGLAEITDAAVVAIDRGGTKELVGYVVASTEGGVDASTIRSALLSTRETYRVPSRFVVLDELPRLPNGKVDRRALPDPDAVLAASSDDTIEGSSGGDHHELRREIRDLWEGLLPVGVVGLNEDFVELGGDSLLAAQMLIMLEQRLGVIVPMGNLVHARTVRELAEVVARLQVDPSLPVSTVAKVQQGDPSRPRLWFVHDLHGSAYRVRHLARHLGLDQPVWSFESPFLAGEPNRYRSLDDLAERYVHDLLVAQPEGPYWLAGYSFGGICAYEMARQLRQAGHEVAFVGVVDVGPGYRGPGWHNGRSPFRPWFGVAKPPRSGAGPREVVEHYVEMVRTSPSGALRHFMVRSGAARAVDPLRFDIDIRRHGRVRPEWRLWYTWEQNWRLAAKAWSRSNRYEGRMDLYWADGTPSADATMGWGSLVPELHIHRFAGDHEGVLEQRGAPQLAKVLRAALDGPNPT